MCGALVMLVAGLVGATDSESTVPYLWPTCADEAADLPFGGVCPPSELQCPGCINDAPIKCPSGLCEENVRNCLPNVNIRGKCSDTQCTGVEYCHMHPGMLYACWEATPRGVDSHHVATLELAQDTTPANACGYCLATLRSHYTCANCCGSQAVVSWSSDTVSASKYHGGGEAFMSATHFSISSGASASMASSCTAAISTSPATCSTPDASAMTYTTLLCRPDTSASSHR